MLRSFIVVCFALGLLALIALIVACFLEVPTVSHWLILRARLIYLGGLAASVTAVVLALIGVRRQHGPGIIRWLASTTVLLVGYSALFVAVALYPPPDPMREPDDRYLQP